MSEYDFPEYKGILDACIKIHSLPLFGMQEKVAVILVWARLLH
jgi:hypothetical protein